MSRHICPKCSEPYDRCACSENPLTTRSALAAARDDVLRAALKDCETHPGDERLCNEDDVCLCDLCAAVDRWQKLEGM